MKMDATLLLQQSIVALEGSIILVTLVVMR
jgi:hypothetical protein